MIRRHPSPRPVPVPRLRNVEGTHYSIDLTMSGDTVRALHDSGFKLFMFKAVESAMGGGRPTVWASTANYSPDTSLNWVEKYYAYASMHAIENGVDFTGSDHSQIDLGQVLEVEENAVVSVSNQGGTAGAVTIHNRTKTRFSCGLSQPNPLGSTKPPTPICAFPLFGSSRDLITPVEKVALVFATSPHNDGTVIESAIGPAVLVDLTGTGHADLSYDADSGWSWAGNVATNIPDDAFVETLVAPPELQGGGLRSPGSGDPANSISVYQSLTGANTPRTLLAHSNAGDVTPSTVSASLTPVSGAPVIRQDGEYYLSYTFQSSRVTELWKVRCTRTGDSTTPYQFAKVSKITP
ncbi:hypothetical protein GCM10010420_21890 [Streptomyces glaucosporus]|uniref:Uncharacterized protein n=1 Tax=Streptomyces glaucosporus TaxID=284044 RepID=A0ABP5V7J8_9ACTN